MSINSKSSTQLAIICQSLFLANLLILPGLSFIILLWFFVKYKDHSRKIKIHLYRAIQLSVAVGIVIFIPLGFILLSEYVPYQLMAMLIYFILVHTGFVLIGTINLARAMGNKLPIF